LALSARHGIWGYVLGRFSCGVEVGVLDSVTDMDFLRLLRGCERPPLHCRTTAFPISGSSVRAHLRDLNLKLTRCKKRSGGIALADRFF
jgi:hypothetical protein